MASSKEQDQKTEQIKTEAVPFGIDAQDVFCLNKKDASDEEQGSAEACDMAYYANWMPLVDNSYYEDVDRKPLIPTREFLICLCSFFDSLLFPRDDQNFD